MAVRSKTGKNLGKKFMTRFCRGTPAKVRTVGSFVRKNMSLKHTICPKTITLQHLIFGQLILGAVK